MLGVEVNTAQDIGLIPPDDIEKILSARSSTANNERIAGNAYGIGVNVSSLQNERSLNESTEGQNSQTFTERSKQDERLNMPQAEDFEPNAHFSGGVKQAALFSPKQERIPAGWYGVEEMLDRITPGLPFEATAGQIANWINRQPQSEQVQILNKLELWPDKHNKPDFARQVIALIKSMLPALAMAQQKGSD